MRVGHRMVQLVAALQARVAGPADQRERGDVPGWVMVTVMTAGLVVAVFAVFKGAITGVVKTALDQVVAGTK